MTVEAEGGRRLGPIDLTLAAGERVAILGPNGAGKSSLLRRIAGLERGAGRIELEGRPIEDFDAPARARRIAYLPQARSIAWPLPVEKIVALGRLPLGADPDRPGPDDCRAIEAALAALGLSAWRDRAATALSAGEQARVLLARALATEAPLLLADEPVAALDPHHQIAVLDALTTRAEAGQAVAIVLHDFVLAQRFASRILLLDRGRLVADDAPEAVLVPDVVDPVFKVATRRITTEGLSVLLPIGARKA